MAARAGDVHRSSVEAQRRDGEVGPAVADGEITNVDVAGPRPRGCVMADRGGVSRFAANARRELMNRGLVDIGSSGHVSVASGGNGFARAIAANTRQVHDQFEASGFTPAELDHFLTVLDDPATLVGSPVLNSTWGRRPT